ncbi:hypothetical protein G3A44_23095, partial [Ideonella sp. TBM-1]|nr:hypothetical protein [Ideonella livida]
MNRQAPHVLEALAQGHVLGTLRPATARGFARLLQRSAAAREAVRQWEERLAALALALPPAEPSAALRERVLARVTR